MPSPKVGSSNLDPTALAYPLLGFWREIDAQGLSNERFAEFATSDRFGVADGMALRQTRQPGAVYLDNAGRTFEIEKVAVSGFVTPLWRRILLMIFRQAEFIEHWVTYEVIELPPMAFEDAKVRVRASIERNQEEWIDDEAMAGEAGEPVRLEDVIASALDAVRGATTVKDLFERPTVAWRY